MPVPTQTLWNIRNLNVVFAVSSVLGMASFIWMLADDNYRPWREHQIDYFNRRAADAHFDVLSLTSDSAQRQRAELEQKVRDEEKKLAQNDEKLRELQAKEVLTNGQLQKAAMSFGNANAEYQVRLFEFEEHKTLYGEKDARTLEVGEKLDHETKQLEQLKLAKESLEEQLEAPEKGIRPQIKALTQPLEKARKAVAEFDKKLADAKKAESMYGAGILRGFFNMPGIDFLAPKGTPGREEVKQIVLPDVRQNYNFLDSYSVDRCTTCHIAIDRPEASPEAFIERAEVALRSVNERRVRNGQKPLVVRMPPEESAPEHGDHAAAEPHHAAAPAQTGETRVAGDSATWPPVSQMTPAQRKRYASALADTLNEYLSDAGRAPIKVEQPLFAHPRLDLFVSADSPHPMSKMGCTACHEGNGQETDFMFAAHTPSTHHQEEEWSDKYVQRKWGIPQATFHLIEEYWDRPMMAAKYTQATCSKCHTQISDLATANHDGMAEKLVQGRALFTQLGCINCHLVEGLGDSRRVGPDLTHVSSKLGTAFIQKWVWYPSDYRPSTFMPHFFRQENNLPSSANEFDSNPTLRTETEVEAITKYLETFSRPYEPRSVPTDIQGDAKRGWEKFTSIGCLACHASLNTVDPTDESKRTFGQRWIENDLVHAGIEREEAARRVGGMDLNARVHYAMEHFTEERHDAAMRELERLRSTGDDTTKLYIPPHFTRFAPELSALGTKLVVDPDSGAENARARQWIYNWLVDPRHFHPDAKMPQLFRENYYWKEPEVSKRQALADQDILDIAEYLLSLRHDTFKPESMPSDAAHEKMARSLLEIVLAGQYSEAAARNLIEDKPLTSKDAYGQLTAAILKQVDKSMDRKAALARIPQRLEDRQMVFLGAKMITHYGCSACHKIAGFETATRPGTELTIWGQKLMSQLDFAFFSPGYESLWKQKPDVFGWLYPKNTAEFQHLVLGNGNEPQQIVHSRSAFAYHKVRNPRIWDREKIKRPYDKLKMPNFFLSPDQAGSIVTFLLSRTQPLVTAAIQVDYAGSPLGGVAAGRHLTRELNCIGCHKIEDNEPVIQQYKIQPDPGGGIMVDELNSPPWLHGEGAKVNHGWLHRFLRQVEMLRPWLNFRMPTFHLDEQQATTLVKYFANVSQRESKDVLKRLAEVHGFKDKAARNAPATTQPVEGRTPGDTWFAEAGFKLIRKFLANYAVRYRLVKPQAINENDPDNKEEDLARGYQRVTDNVEFLGRLYDVPYPFADTPRPVLGTERFDHGEKMFLELKCLACHVLGDMRAPGSNATPSAPNLSLTHDRLQRSWVRSWLQYPGLIQPGTKMPQWWGKGGSLESFPPEDQVEFAKKYGATPDEQMSLLEDYLYEAGYRNHTAVAPPEPAAPATSEPQTAPEDDFSDLVKPGAASQPASRPAADEFQP